MKLRVRRHDDDVDNQYELIELFEEDERGVKKMSGSLEVGACQVQDEASTKHHKRRLPPKIVLIPK